MTDYPRWEGSQMPGPEPMGERLREGAAQIGEAAQSRREQARRLSEALRRRAERARILAADGLSRAANTLRGSAVEPNSTARHFAENLERGAVYLRDTDLAGMQRDAEQLVRRYPGQALGAAFVVGLLLGRRLPRR